MKKQPAVKMPVRAILGTSLMLLTLGAVAPRASAHGEQTHAQKSFDPASAEQKEFGIAGNPKKAARTIRITMSDSMRFTPDRITIRQGETVKFVVANRGRMLHEMVLGTMAELKEHAEMMRKFPEMEHEEPHMAHVGAGKREEIVWTFNRAGDFHFACLISGHFDAGMVGRITVVAGK